MKEGRLKTIKRQMSRDYKEVIKEDRRKEWQYKDNVGKKEKIIKW